MSPARRDRGPAEHAPGEPAGAQDAGPVVLWEFAVLLRLLGDTHLGAARAVPRHAAHGDVDLPLDRDPASGAPRLRATTLAGLLRHELARRAGERRAARLFGDADGASALHLDDAVAELPAGAGVAVRTGNRVDPATGAAVPGGLWQAEVLPAGTVFAVRLHLHVADAAAEAELLGLLAAAADGLTGEGPGIRLGGRGGRGYGAVRAAAWHARRHDLTREDGWFAYYGRTWRERRADLERGLAGAPGDVRAAVGAVLAEQCGAAAAAAFAEAAAAVPDGRRWAEVRLGVAVGERPTEAFLGGWRPGEVRPGLLMVGDAPRLDRMDTADRVHLRRPADTSGQLAEQPLLGDTALFALFKRIGRRLARDLGEARGADWRAWHERWWGADPATGGGSGPPSRIRLRRAPVIDEGSPWRAARLTVDALFADAVAGRMTTEELHCGGRAEVVLDVWEPDEAVLGMLALVVRELATVAFDTAGSGAGAGHGRLAVVSAEVVPAPGEAAVDVLAAVGDPVGGHRARVQRWVDAWTSALAGGEEGT